MHHNRGTAEDPLHPVYEVPAAYSSVSIWMAAGLLAITLVPGIAFLYFAPEGALALLACTAFDGLLLYAVLPRRYQLLPDRLRIVLGRPFALTFRLDTISEVRSAQDMETLVYWGVRFVTSTTSAVEIVRKRGLNFMISPAHPEDFIEQLNRALQNAYGRPGTGHP